MVTYTLTNGTIADADEVNQNFNDVQEFAAIGIAQNAYQTLQANNVFDNKDYLAADEFTDSTGTNNTVSTGSSTAEYDGVSDSYELTLNIDATQATAIVQDLTVSTNSYNGMKIYMNSARSLLKIEKMPNSTATQAHLLDSSKTLVATATFDGNIATFSSAVSLSNATTYYFATSIVGGGNYTMVRDTIASFPINLTEFNITGGLLTGDDSTNQMEDIKIVTFGDGTYETDNIVVCDTNTLTLDGTETSICVYTNVDLPADTSITVDISDGTTTLSAQAITKNSTGVIDISSLSSGTLELTFNLATTDTDVTPSLYGYGVFLK